MNPRTALNVLFASTEKSKQSKRKHAECQQAFQLTDIDLSSFTSY